MTTRSLSDARIDRSIEAWLDLGPTELPQRVLDSARIEIHRTRQRRAWWMGWTVQLRPRTRLAASLGAAVMVIVLIGLGLRLASTPKVGASPSPSTTSSPTVLRSFHATGSMSIGRVGHTATLLRDGRVLIAGGTREVGAFGVTDPGPIGALTSAVLYDPTTGTFAVTGSMSVPRSGHTATLLADGRVLVAGGTNGFVTDQSGVANELATAELYDPASGTFSPTGSMTTSRVLAAAAMLDDGRVLITGGLDYNPAGPSPASSDLYDPSTGTFRATGLMASSLSPEFAVPLADGRVLTWIRDGTDDGQPKVEFYIPSNDTYTRAGAPRSIRVGQTLGVDSVTALADGHVLVIVGVGGDTRTTPVETFAELYDPASGALLRTGQPVSVQSYATATLMPDGRVLVVGGLDRAFQHQLADSEVYDPTTGTFASTSPLGTARAGHTATLLLDGRVLIVGGGAVGDGSPAFNTAELFE
jgi:hypothetical protein